jgi:UrcA family protein
MLETDMKLTPTKAALVIACLAVPALAQDYPIATETRIVSTQGLDLSDPRDVRTLDRKLGLAIADVCGTGSAADPERVRRVRDCRRAVRAQVAPDRSRAISASDHERDGMLAAQTR